jgi:putative PIN family toxin of toxin-antitoxin system
MLKVVLDTNIFVSSLLVKAGLPAQVLDTWRERQYLLVVSPAIVAETRATLNYPRIRRKFAITDEDVEQLVTLLERDALVVPGDADVAGAIPDDPADEIVLACAVDAQADVIVSGDRHLLELGSHRSIPILTARQFLERLNIDPSESAAAE